MDTIHRDARYGDAHSSDHPHPHNTELDDEAKKKAVMDAVHMQFKPEFINRLDELVWRRQRLVSAF